jgi:hypothetical protein
MISYALQRQSSWPRRQGSDVRSSRSLCLEALNCRPGNDQFCAVLILRNCKHQHTSLGCCNYWGWIRIGTSRRGVTRDRSRVLGRGAIGLALDGPATESGLDFVDQVILELLVVSLLNGPEAFRGLQCTDRHRRRWSSCQLP